MKRISLICAICAICGLSSRSATVLTFNPTNGAITRYFESVETLQWLLDANAIVNPALPTNRLALCYVTNRTVQLKTQAMLDAEAAAAVAAQAAAVAAQRSNMIALASAYVHGTNAEGRILRAFALLTLDQVNTLRKLHSLALITTNQFLAAMSNAVIADPK